jgi:hypothetical protein
MLKRGANLWEKISPITIFTNVNSPPAPRPWSALPVINIPILIAAPHSVLPTMNTATAPSNSGFLPQISLSFPQVGVEAAVASKKADPIQM